MSTDDRFYIGIGDARIEVTKEQWDQIKAAEADVFAEFSKVISRLEAMNKQLDDIALKVDAKSRELLRHLGHEEPTPKLFLVKKAAERKGGAK